MRLRDCPFHLLADRHPPLICGMNLALLEGLLSAPRSAACRPGSDPRPEECCVVLESETNDD